MSKSVIDIVAPISEHVPSDYEMKMGSSVTWVGKINSFVYQSCLHL